MIVIFARYKAVENTFSRILVSFIMKCGTNMRRIGMWEGIRSSMCDPIDIHREVSALLRRCTEKYHNEPECTRIAWLLYHWCIISSSYIRSAWRENIKRIAELRKEVKRLEMSLQSIDSDDETIEVIPEQYLTSTKPYKCGVPNCSESFSCYQDLEAHASSHPGISLCKLLFMEEIWHSCCSQQSIVHSWRATVSLSDSNLWSLL